MRFWTLNSQAFFLRVAFLCLAFPLVVVLSLRPIPTQGSGNDTGRYIANQAEACSLPAFTADAAPSLPDRVFNLMMRPLCWAPLPAAFLFIAGISIPFALVVFGEWKHQGAFLIAVSVLLSTVGFEFATNALRQGVSLVFLLAAFASGNRYVRIAALAAALLIHDSSWFYAPLVFLLIVKSHKVTFRTVILWGIPLVAGLAFLVALRFASRFTGVSAAFDYYRGSYDLQVSPAFLLFIIAPLFFIFAIRWLDKRGLISREERLAFWYSAALLVASMVIFPAITYRFAMTAILIQLFFVMRSPTLSVRSATPIFLGMVAHFAFFAFWSKNVMTVLHG